MSTEQFSKYGLYLKECLNVGVAPLSPKDWREVGSPDGPTREVSELDAPSPEVAREGLSVAFLKCFDMRALGNEYIAHKERTAQQAAGAAMNRLNATSKRVFK